VPTLETDQLADLIARKYRVLVELCQLGRRQEELIAANDMGQLLMLLEAKQRLFVVLDEVRRGLEPARGTLPDEREWRSAADRAQSAQWLLRCESLLAEVIEQETQSIERLSQLRDATALRLDTAQTASQARHVYADRAGRAEGQLDLLSER
jgi:hypothetical protein